jgi:mannose-6-phosphate isomerase-like protein (cupin superfamily)
MTLAPVVLGPDEARALRDAAGVVVSDLLNDTHGCRGLHQRRLAFEDGAVLAGMATGYGESWFVLGGAGQLHPGVSLVAGTALWLPRSASYEVTADSGLEILATTVRVGSPEDDAAPQVVSLADCAVEYTGDREFRVLLSAGLAFTQFAGLIPPGRAPAHHHSYDEIVHVLAGRGVLHLATGDREIGAGTAIYLPPYHEHCLENTGTEPLRVLGVFHPAGSPAAKH